MVRRFWIHSIQGKGGKIRLSQALQFYLWFPWAGSLMLHRLGTTPRQRSQSLRNPSNLGEIIPGEIMKLFDHGINLFFLGVNHLKLIKTVFITIYPTWGHPFSLHVEVWGPSSALLTSCFRPVWPEAIQAIQAIAVAARVVWSYFIVIWPYLTYINLHSDYLYYLLLLAANQYVGQLCIIWARKTAIKLWIQGGWYGFKSFYHRNRCLEIVPKFRMAPQLWSVPRWIFFKQI